ncbi:adenylyl-sulfate kinase [Desulfovibrio ferrophilus]|uniref:Adenylyl-sulfate kinase n=1 Tax=Desulfovibrio ferrophilus TaxID=241368 RepID=A0A2Z6B0I8_9BACT|nr:adenylyl-sulfate kinase [Desulfovibrio ferrophilus]BBD09012.1 adenylylsulfate kinase [Desulfovibrio ferrophilus]
MGFTLWFTGLSGAGKSTLSMHVYLEIRRRMLKAELLDGDLIRTNFSSELGFSREHRDLNVRRIGFISHLLNKNGVNSVVAAIAPFEEARQQNRTLLDNYVEIWCKCPLEVVESRDVKGLYARARAGEIKAFTGITSPYEEPVGADIVCETDKETVTVSVRNILEWLEDRDFLPKVENCKRRDYSKHDEESWRQRLAELGYAKQR